MGINRYNDKDFNCVKNRPVYSNWIHVSFILKSLTYIYGFYTIKKGRFQLFKFMLN